MFPCLATRNLIDGALLGIIERVGIEPQRSLESGGSFGMPTEGVQILAHG
jgi:hypothetical protein